MKNTSTKIFFIALATGLCGAAFAHGEGHGDHTMQMMDANADGKVTAAEHAAGAKSMFTAMDANKDGKVTAIEMDASRHAMNDHKDMKDHKEMSDKKDMSHDAKMKPEMTAADKIKVIDTDGDGVLTAKEHETGSARMFTKMDTDKDGVLTAQEIEKGHKAMMTAKE